MNRIFAKLGYFLGCILFGCWFATAPDWEPAIGFILALVGYGRREFIEHKEIEKKEQRHIDNLQKMKQVVHNLKSMQDRIEVMKSDNKKQQEQTAEMRKLLNEFQNQFKKKKVVQVRSI